MAACPAYFKQGSKDILHYGTHRLLSQASNKISNYICRVISINTGKCKSLQSRISMGYLIRPALFSLSKCPSGKYAANCFCQITGELRMAEAINRSFVLITLCKFGTETMLWRLVLGRTLLYQCRWQFLSDTVTFGFSKENSRIASSSREIWWFLKWGTFKTGMWAVNNYLDL